MTENTENTATTDLYLSNDPAMIAAFIKHRKATVRAAAFKDETRKTPPYNFADFVTEMNMTDFEDIYQIRAMLESQAHLLGTAFQYLMMDGDWKNLKSILRTQKVMRDTIEMMNHYPPVSDLAIQKLRLAELTAAQAAEHGSTPNA